MTQMCVGAACWVRPPRGAARARLKGEGEAWALNCIVASGCDTFTYNVAALPPRELLGFLERDQAAKEGQGAGRNLVAQEPPHGVRMHRNPARMALEKGQPHGEAAAVDGGLAIQTEQARMVGVVPVRAEEAEENVALLLCLERRYERAAFRRSSSI